MSCFPLLSASVTKVFQPTDFNTNLNDELSLKTGNLYFWHAIDFINQTLLLKVLGWFLVLNFGCLFHFNSLSGGHIKTQPRLGRTALKSIGRDTYMRLTADSRCFLCEKKLKNGPRSTLHRTAQKHQFRLHFLRDREYRTGFDLHMLSNIWEILESW